MQHFIEMQFYLRLCKLIKKQSYIIFFKFLFYKNKLASFKSFWTNYFLEKNEDFKILEKRIDYLCKPTSPTNILIGLGIIEEAVPKIRKSIQKEFASSHTKQLKEDEFESLNNSIYDEKSQKNSILIFFLPSKI